MTGAPSPGAPRVLMYGKPGCHLCDVARETIEHALQLVHVHGTHQ